MRLAAHIYLVYNTKRNDCDNFDTLNIIKRWRNNKDDENNNHINPVVITQHIPKRIKNSKQEWFEKIIRNNKLIIGEYKSIFLNISLKMRSVKMKKDFQSLLQKIGNDKVLFMFQLLTEKELKLWLPSMTCVQLEVICMVLSIKQSGKKEDKLKRIINCIDRDGNGDK